MRYYCRSFSAGSPLSTNLQLYFLQRAAECWNKLDQEITERGIDGVKDLKEKQGSIIVSLGLTLSQLLGQNSPSPDKIKMDPPGILLSNFLARSKVDRNTQRRLNKTFGEFLPYYDSVRHFGINKGENHYQTLERLTLAELSRFCCMSLEVWDAVIAMLRDDEQNDLDALGSISDPCTL